MRLITLTLALALIAPPEGATEPEVGTGAGAPAVEVGAGDLLGELVVQAAPDRPLKLPKLALEKAPELAGVHAVFEKLAARDLDLSGQFAVLTKGDAVVFDTPLDAEKWRRKGVEYVVRTRAELLDDGRVRLELRVFMPELGELPAADLSEVVVASQVRQGGHRLVDRAIGSLTGVDGPFDSRILVVAREGGRGQRRLYGMDVDGQRLRALSPAEHTVITATFGPDGVPYWAGGPRGTAHRVYRFGQDEPVSVGVRGSVYGLAYDAHNERWAVAVAQQSRIQLFTGRSLDSLKVATDVEFALAPTFAPDGKLIYSATKGRSTRIRTAKRAYSPSSAPATHPRVCDGPDGTHVVYQMGREKKTEIYRAPFGGGPVERLTGEAGQNHHPACSPDGRLIAFASTRRSGQGPGLYLMRADGRRAKRIAALLPEEIHWAR